MAPINIRRIFEKTEDWLKETGTSELRQLPRGTDLDRMEQVYQKMPCAELIFGVGDQRYFFKKK